MTTPPDSESAFTPAPTNKITQDINETQGQIIAQMMGGLAIGQLKLYLYQAQTPPKARETDTDSVELGQNPYQGLKAFREMDGDRFFGRDTQIKELWERFQQLHGDRTTIRVLPIYGPSGSGKSSLARAGLIPALGKQPLPGQDQGRVVVITPGNDPLEALATVLARIATQDTTPVAKTREFKNELLQLNTQQEFDGLRRIANAFPDITDSSLIVLVDQFEELYTLCNDEQVRSAFVENLLCAASDSSQRVSVIITMRSDFLGKTQQHPRLNQLFSSQGFLVPIMQPEELAIAITEPAKRARYELDRAVVELLINETQGQEGALPLLQFALTQIWEGLRKDVKPVDTLKQIGGVGGALANEAKRLYHSLTPEQQTIARSTFLALIQLNDDHKATRRRAPFSELITSKQDEPLVRKVIERFARPGVWILMTFSNEQQVEMVEVAHETLIRNWEELQGWLDKHWVDVLKKRKIEQAATEWQDHSKSKDYLLQRRVLRDAREFLQATINSKEVNLSTLATEFITSSQQHFALTEIWEGLRNGVRPANTLELEQIGDMGVALANEAKRLYDSLTPDHKKIARSIFLALIQLNDDYQNTRRRASISELITSEQDAPFVREVIDQFVHQGVWSLVTFSNEQQIEMVEVVHEALICNWEYLQHWLEEQWKKLRKKREIEQFALEWENNKKSKNYLLQGRSLRDAKEFLQAQKENTETSLSGLAKEFVQASRRKQLQGFLKIAIIPFMGTLIIINLFILNLAQAAIHKKDCQQDLMMPIFVRYLVFVGQKKHLEKANFCDENLSGLNLSEATLFRADFRLSQLENTNFHKAFLVKTNFQSANLKDANFSKASLEDADFSEASLENANFQGSLLYKTKLSTAKEITDEQLEKSLLCNTELPKKSRLNPKRDCEKLGL